VADYRQLLACSDAELARVDPLVMNLLVAQGIPSLADLDITRYQERADQWADGIRARLPMAERVFRRTPGDWKNDVRFLRLAVLCEYVDRDLGIGYRADQKDLTAVSYTDPSDLFLNGVMDTRRGTCSNMSMLHVALGWRLGWPVSLACVRWHRICRFDDGTVTYNIEATQTGIGGFKSPPDDYYIAEFGLTPKAISSGSDLRAVSPRELLGIIMGLRGRHMQDTGRRDDAERDYLLARHMFPSNRELYMSATELAVEQSVRMFEPGELGSPQSLADWLGMRFRLPDRSMRAQPKDLPFQNITYQASV
jgi:Transglutaminase-like superfamily